MAQVLLRRVGRIPEKQYVAEIAKMAKVTVTVQSETIPKIEMYSVEEAKKYFDYAKQSIETISDK